MKVNQNSGLTVVGTGSYTVPTGKTARILASISASAYTTSTSGTHNGPGTLLAKGGEDSSIIELFLKSGDVITTSLVNASGSISVSSTYGWIENSSSSIASLLVNGVIIATVRAVVTASIFAQGTTLFPSITFSGATSFGYISNEY